MISSDNDVARGLDQFREVPLFFVKRRVQQQAAHADYAVQRRADFMAHLCKEFALGAAGVLGGVFGLSQLRFRLLSRGNVADERGEGAFAAGPCGRDCHLDGKLPAVPPNRDDFRDRIE